MWTVETLNEIVDAEILALPVDLRARLVRILNLIEAVGLQNLPHDMAIPVPDEFNSSGTGSAATAAARHVARSRAAGWRRWRLKPRDR